MQLEKKKKYFPDISSDNLDAPNLGSWSLSSFNMGSSERLFPCYIVFIKLAQLRIRLIIHSTAKFECGRAHSLKMFCTW